MSLAELQDALIAGGCNKADQVIALITASIEDGIVNGSEIVSTISGLGYKKQYVGLVLSKNVGLNPERSRLMRDTDGHYRMNE